MAKAACIVFSVILAVHALPAIAADGTQKISVAVTQAGTKLAAVPCTLTNKFGSWDLIAPGVAAVRRAPDDLIVTCRKDGMTSRHALKSKLSGEWCWNASKCGGFGFVINEQSGVGYEYPDKASVELR